MRLSKRMTMRSAAIVVLAGAFNLFNRSNFSEVNAVFGRQATDEPARHAGASDVWAVREALPPRQAQLAVRVGTGKAILPRRPPVSTALSGDAAAARIV
jgi:hypothetical protein